MAFVQVPVIRGLTEIEPFLAMAARHDAVICGGYARYACSPQKDPAPAGDIDFFPRTVSGCAGVVDELKALKYKVVHENSVSITMGPDEGQDPVWATRPTPQVIKPMREGKVVTYGTVEEILENFDFTVVRIALVHAYKCVDCGHPKMVHLQNVQDAERGRCEFPDCRCEWLMGVTAHLVGIADDDFLADERNGVIQIKNIHCPISSTLRCMKYARKKYFVGPGQVLKLFQDWNNRGPEYQVRMSELFLTSQMGQITQREIDELEDLLRVD